MSSISKDFRRKKDIKFEKCGDILKAQNVYAFCCIFCSEIFIQMPTFARHLQLEHCEEFETETPKPQWPYTVEELFDKNVKETNRGRVKKNAKELKRKFQNQLENREIGDVKRFKITVLLDDLEDIALEDCSILNISRAHDDVSKVEFCDALDNEKDSDLNGDIIVEILNYEETNESPAIQMPQIERADLGTTCSEYSQTETVSNTMPLKIINPNERSNKDLGFIPKYSKYSQTEAVECLMATNANQQEEPFAINDYDILIDNISKNKTDKVVANLKSLENELVAFEMNNNNYTNLNGNNSNVNLEFLQLQPQCFDTEIQIENDLNETFESPLDLTASSKIPFNVDKNNNEGKEISIHQLSEDFEFKIPASPKYSKELRTYAVRKQKALKRMHNVKNKIFKMMENEKSNSTGFYKGEYNSNCCQRNLNVTNDEKILALKLQNQPHHPSNFVPLVSIPLEFCRNIGNHTSIKEKTPLNVAVDENNRLSYSDNEGNFQEENKNKIDEIEIKQDADVTIEQFQQKLSTNVLLVGTPLEFSENSKDIQNIPETGENIESNPLNCSKNKDDGSNQVDTLDDLELLEKIGLQIIKDPHIHDNLSLDQEQLAYNRARKFALILKEFNLIRRLKRNYTKTPKKINEIFQQFTQEINKQFAINFTVRQMKKIRNMLINWYSTSCRQKVLSKKILPQSVNFYLKLFSFLPRSMRRIFYCEYCDERFKSIAAYKIHVKNHESIESEKNATEKSENETKKCLGELKNSKESKKKLRPKTHKSKGVAN